MAYTFKRECYCTIVLYIWFLGNQKHFWFILCCDCCFIALVWNKTNNLADVCLSIISSAMVCSPSHQQVTNIISPRLQWQFLQWDWVLNQVSGFQNSSAVHNKDLRTLLSFVPSSILQKFCLSIWTFAPGYYIHVLHLHIHNILLSPYKISQSLKQTFIHNYLLMEKNKKCIVQKVQFNLQPPKYYSSKENAEHTLVILSYAS